MHPLLPPLPTPSLTFLTSPILPAPILTTIHLLFALYGLTVNITDYIYYSTTHSGTSPGSQFSYFTILTYWGLTFYFLVTGIHGFFYLLIGYSHLDTWSASSNKYLRSFVQLHSIFYTTIITLPFLVTIVYWSTLYSSFPTPFNAWDNVSRHALNSVFALFAIIVPATPPPPYIHILALLVILALYLAVAYITHATQGFYVYPFLDPSQGAGKLVGWLFGIGFGTVGVFLTVRGLIWVRNWTLLRWKGSKEGKRSYRDLERERVEEAKRSLSDLANGVGIVLDVEAMGRNGSDGGSRSRESLTMNRQVVGKRGSLVSLVL